MKVCGVHKKGHFRSHTKF